MNKQEAAEFLGVSVRGLERYVQQGRIGSRYEKGKTRPTLVFDKAELETFKAELEQKLYRPAVESPNLDNSATVLAKLSPSSSMQSEAVDFEDFSAMLEALLKHQSSSTTPAHYKLLLTLADVQELTGLSRSILREAIRKGSLKAKIIGKSWRVKYTDLEKYIQKLF